MRELVRSLDWAATPLGPIDGWPPHLRLAVGLCLDSAFPVALYWGPRFTLLYNDAWAPLLGERHPEALGRPAREVWDDAWDTFRPELERVMATGQATSATGVLFPVRRNGSTEACDLDDTLSPIRGEDGTIGGVIHTAANRRDERDITDRKQAEESLRWSQRQYQELVASVDGIVWEADARTCAFSFVSPQAERLLGYPVGLWLAEPGFRANHIHPDDRDRAVEACAATGERRNHDFEYRMLAADGRVVWVRDIVTGVTEGGKVTRLRGIMTDITAWKHAEEALRHGHSLLNAVVEVISDAIYVKDLQGRYLMINAACAGFLGMTVGEVVGRDDRDLFPPETARVVMDRDRQVMTTGERVTFEETVTAAGVTRTYLSTKGAYRDPHGKVTGLIGISRDITAQKRAEQALRDSEQRFRTFVDHATDTFFLHDTRGKILDANQRACESLGYTRDELVGMTPADFDPDATPARYEMIGRALEAGEVIAFDSHHRRKDGSVFPVEVRIGPFWQAGRRLGVSLARDITARKRAEEQLRASLREKDVLLKEVHHRVKNNLQLISSLLALQAGTLTDPAAAALVESQNRVRAMALVHEHLYRSGDLASVRLAGHVEALCAELYRSHGVDPGRVTLDLRVADLTLDLDRSIRCGLVVNELVSNALKHAFPGSRPGRVGVQLDARPEGCYTLTVADNGVGLPPAFDPGRCDSLGLQLVCDLAAQLGGSLTWSRNGGTAVTVRFPRDRP
jgi:PAS domain S-box-containing protein